MKIFSFYHLLIGVLCVFAFSQPALAHPLRLSLSEIDYSSDSQLLTMNLRLFLMDVNEALVFDPESKELAFCQPNESVNAEPMLLAYLNQFFHIKLDDKKLELKISSKKLQGEGINTALAVEFSFTNIKPFSTIEIKNAVFTDLFFDQNNIVYLHVDGESDSLMLSKDTPTHRLEY